MTALHESAYKEELLKLRELAQKADFSPSGNVEYRQQLKVTKLAYWIMVKASMDEDKTRPTKKAKMK